MKRSVWAVLALALIVGGCAAMQQMSQTVNEVGQTVDEMDRTATEADRTATKIGDGAEKVGEGAQKLQLEGQASCCINGQYFDCPNAEEAGRCVGQPQQLMDCISGCNDDSCDQTCVDRFGPNPGGCSRDTTKDGTCN